MIPVDLETPDQQVYRKSQATTGIDEEIIKNFNQQLQNTTIPKKMKNARRYHVKWLQNWSNQTATDILKYVDSMMKMIRIKELMKGAI